MEEIIKKYSTLIYTFVIGIIVHGSIIFYKISFHDDIWERYGVGTTSSSGRWFLEYINRAITKYYGGNFNCNGFNALVTIIVLGILAHRLAGLMSVRGEFGKFAIGGVLVVYPVITGLFGYVYTAPFYAVVLLMAEESAHLLITSKRSIKRYILGAVLLAFALGIYQAYLTFCACVYLMYMLFDSDKDLGPFFTEGIVFLSNMVTGLILYLLCNKLHLARINETLSDYKNMNNYDMTTIGGYIKRISLAYREFFHYDQSSHNMYNTLLLSGLYVIALLIIGVYFLFLIVKTNNNIFRIEKSLLLLVLPICINSIYVINDYSNIGTLMVYSQVFTWIILVVIGDRVSNIYVKKTIYVCILCLLITYWRFNNICYMKANQLQARAISYFNQLKTTSMMRVIIQIE